VMETFLTQLFPQPIECHENSRQSALNEIASLGQKHHHCSKSGQTNSAQIDAVGGTAMQSTNVDLFDCTGPDFAIDGPLLQSVFTTFA